MTKTAIISDVNANIDSLEQVLLDIDKRKVDKIVVLGNSVNYGPKPNEVMKLLMSRADLMLLGNHDEFISAEDSKSFSEEFLDISWFAGLWTRMEMGIDPERGRNSKRTKQGQDYINLIQGLKSIHYDGEVGYANSNFEGGWECIEDPDPYHEELNARKSFGYMLEKGATIGFIGHSHKPKVYTLKKKSDGNKPKEVEDDIGIVEEPPDNMEFDVGPELILENDDPAIKRTDGHHLEMKCIGHGLYELKDGESYIFNVGSVGQPRDGDPRACYGILDDKKRTVEIIKIRFNKEKVEFQLQETLMSQRVIFNNKIWRTDIEAIRKSTGMNIEQYLAHGITEGS